MVDEVLEGVDLNIALIGAIECGSIREEVLYRTQNSCEVSWSTLKSFSVGLRVLENLVMLLAHCLVIPSPLRIVTHCNGWGESVIKARLFQTVSSPVPCVEEMFGVVGT